MTEYTQRATDGANGREPILNQREQRLLSLFRALDEQGRADILRFMEVLAMQKLG
jgi:hypothetical protein